jgi:cytochrome P450
MRFSTLDRVSRDTSPRSSTLVNIGAVGENRIQILTPAQLATLLLTVARGVLWSRRATSRELRVWRRRAAAVPDATIRADALDAIVRKRDNAEGAALFSILPKRRNGRLLKLLVAYQVMWDYLDSASERGASAGPDNGRQLHRALVEALDPDAPISDYYRYHPWKDDGGFLRGLVQTCRSLCVSLPSYGHVYRLMLDGVERCAIQSLNHDPDSNRRDAALRRWAKSEYADTYGLEWFELTAAASAFMPHVFLALAADSPCAPSDLRAVHSAYFPHVSLAIAMLDSYVDHDQDLATNSHSYISHYPNRRLALERLATIVKQATSRTADLPNGRRHTVIVASMVAMYLSKKSANTPRVRGQTRCLLRAGGPLVTLLLPAAGVWRTVGAREVASGPVKIDLPPGLRAPRVVQTFVFWRSPFAYYKHCRFRCGSRFTLRALGHPPMVFFTDPGEVRIMLAASPEVLHAGEGAQMLEPIAGASSFMLLDEGEHLFGRRAVLPALVKRTVERNAERVVDTARSVAESWPRDIPMSLHPRLRALTLEVVLRGIFFTAEHQPEPMFSLLLDRVLAMLAVTASGVFALPILRHGPGRAIWMRFLRDRSDVDALIHSLIDERLRLDRAGHDALAALLAARDENGGPMPRRQLRDNVMSLILAGHETTASQLAWAFQLLAHNPRVQRRLIEEIDRDADDVYLTATIQEVLRHRPVFLFTIPRAVAQPIEIGGWTFRPPVRLLGCIYLLHHDPDVYPEPQEFRPERFLEGQPGPYTYLPWGGGRRRCPGSHLALLEMKTVLRAVLETMTVDPANRRMERPKWRSVIVTPHAGSRVILRPRERRHGTTSRTRPATVGAWPVPAVPATHTADPAERGP